MTRIYHVPRYVVFTLAVICGVATEVAQPQKTVPAQKKSGNFWEWVLRVTGVSASTSTLKGADDEVVTGQVWCANLKAGTSQQLTSDAGYRSPVFFSDGLNLLAIKGNYVLRIRTASLAQQRIATVPGITKLIGFDREDSSQVLLLAEDDAGHAKVELLSLSTGKLQHLAYDPESSRDRQMLESLQGWERIYPTGTVYVKREAGEAMSGRVEHSNVFWKQPGRDPVNVSRCELANCGQPSASSDGSKIAFIKALP